VVNKGRIVSAAEREREREREEDLPQISPGKRVSARVCRDSNVGASSFISRPFRSTFPSSCSFVEKPSFSRHSLGLPIYAITNSDEKHIFKVYCASTSVHDYDPIFFDTHTFLCDKNVIIREKYVRYKSFDTLM